MVDGGGFGGGRVAPVEVRGVEARGESLVGQAPRQASPASRAVLKTALSY